MGSIIKILYQAEGRMLNFDDVDEVDFHIIIKVKDIKQKLQEFWNKFKRSNGRLVS